jgi:hypothetical protein
MFQCPYLEKAMSLIRGRRSTFDSPNHRSERLDDKQAKGSWIENPMWQSLNALLSIKELNAEKVAKTTNVGSNNDTRY